MYGTAKKYAQSFSITSATSSASINVSRARGYAIVASVTATNPVGASVKLQASLDEIVWVDIDQSSTSITNSANVFWNVEGPYYAFVRLTFAITSGSLAVELNAMIKSSL